MTAQRPAVKGHSIFVGQHWPTSGTVQYKMTGSDDITPATSSMSTSTSSTRSSSSSSSTADTCWCWMKDAKSRIEHPIEPLDQYDNRPAVKDLIAKHRGEIDKIKSVLKDDPLYQPLKHDDLWIMRFLFSHDSHHESALAAAQSTLQFRHEHNLDAHDIRGMEVRKDVLLEDKTFPFAHAAGKMLSCYEDDTQIYYTPDVRRGVIGFLQLAGRNQHKMVETLGEQDYFEAHIFFSEWKFQWLDYNTRTTGLLTKYQGIADCHGVKMNMINKESKKRDGAAAKILEDKYPQLLGSMVVVNAPGWINVVFAIIKPFLPKRLLAKVNLIKPLRRERDLHSLLQYCSMEYLPSRYGGELQEWPPKVILPEQF